MKYKTIKRTIYGIVTPILIGISGATYAQDCDCSQILINFSKANSQVEKLGSIEMLSFRGLKRNPNNPLDKRELDITRKLKGKAIEKRNKILKQAKDCGCI